MGSGGGNCGLPDGELHMHSGRCYEAGRREVIARVQALADAAEMFEDHYGNEFGPLVFADDLRAALEGR